jgi:hypothetical protein
MLLAAMNARPQQVDPARQHEVAMKQASVTLDAAMFILEHAPLFPIEAQKHACDFILRVLAGLDNIRVQQQPTTAPSE